MEDHFGNYDRSGPLPSSLTHTIREIDEPKGNDTYNVTYQVH